MLIGKNVGTKGESWAWLKSSFHWPFGKSVVYLVMRYELTLLLANATREGSSSINSLMYVYSLMSLKLSYFEVKVFCL
jgi:hypothetical protein